LAWLIRAEVFRPFFLEDLRTKYFAIEISLPLAVEPKGNCPQLVPLE
jgi:hypothetical protein